MQTKMKMVKMTRQSRSIRAIAETCFFLLILLETVVNKLQFFMNTVVVYHNQILRVYHYHGHGILRFSLFFSASLMHLLMYFSSWTFRFARIALFFRNRAVGFKMPSPTFRSKLRCSVGMLFRHHIFEGSAGLPVHLFK